ncbi:GyrI-like domain-containing protein [Microbacterium hatanonis]|jgi:hypothetical protein|uniref:GyrI-like small molecule binding domain-containing protein n=1 Tax=Microbacterium hatanonis TaxID=404366 RepID=A0A5C8I367_9MICO|nr:GyrI-like domain-containing protein [Microbacterium hatanonis]TXK13462.1 hypothetical protein FVP77_08720 [Microbacterium hatanonis]
MTPKIDLKTEIDAYRAPRDRFRIVDVPDLTYLMIDGSGDPNTSPVFASAVAALYPLAYALKFASKRELDRDYVVMPLEGLWWADDMDAFTTSRDKSRWDWTLLMVVPPWIDDDAVARARDAVGRRSPPERLDEVRLESLCERRCVQTLHVGSFDSEGPLLQRMHEEFLPAHGLRLAGRHHEIYLSDARRVAPGKRRTILRQPVR